MKKKIKNTLKGYRPPKFLLYLIILMPIFLCFTKTENIDNDIWFLLSHGRYVFSNGIPHIEPFTMHSGFSFVMQQWLSATIFWGIYKVSSFVGLRIFICLIFIVITYLIKKLCDLLSDNNTVLSFIVTFIFQMLIEVFIVNRPQVLTYLVLISELYLLELYIKKKNKKYLYLLPVLSLLEINLHASMWFMQFLFILPYVIDSFKIKLGFIEGEGYSRKPLLITIIVMGLVGFINPYGVKAITYLFGSFGIPEINNFIQEMNSLSVDGLMGKIFFGAIFGVLFVYVFYKKGKLKLRYFLLYCGTVFLSLLNFKSVALFMISSIFPLSYYLKDAFSNIKCINYESKKFTYSCIIVYILVLISACIPLRKIEYPDNSKAINYVAKSYDKEKIKLYTDYDDGSYAEFVGLKPYIDPRAEVFLKSNNKKEDIYIEFYNFETRNVQCEAFKEKYKFDVVVLKSNSAFYGCIYKNYNQVYGDKNRAVFERKK